MAAELMYKLNVGDADIDYEIIPYSEDNNENQIDDLLKENSERIAELSDKIEKLQVEADSWDYAISLVSGSLSGLFDIFFVGELSLLKDWRECREFGDKEAEKIVKKAAKITGYEEKEGGSLSDAIEHLQTKFHIASDQRNIESAFGGSNLHHFRDFTHHPTVMGWVFSMIMQFTKYVFGANEFGMLIVKKVDKETFIGKDPFQKILFGTIHWLFHMVSDIAGTDVTAGAGTGLPGPILSLLKEIDSVRVKIKSVTGEGEKADKLTIYLSKLFNGTLLGEHDENGKIIKDKKLRFDYRTEMGLMHNVKEVAELFLPVVINDCVVRSFFFIKRFILGIKLNNVNSISDLDKLDWKRIIPFNNATLTRMLTISVGTMEVIDLSDAAIRGAIEAGKVGAAGAGSGALGGPCGAVAGATTGSVAAFWKTFALRVNYVGVGRFVICLGTEFTFEARRQKLLIERIAAYNAQLKLMDAKVMYREMDMWIAAEEAGRAIEEAYQLIGFTEKYHNDSISEMQFLFDSIEDCIDSAEEKNPGLTESMLDSMKWGL